MGKKIKLEYRALRDDEIIKKGDLWADQEPDNEWMPFDENCIILWHKVGNEKSVLNCKIGRRVKHCVGGTSRLNYHLKRKITT